MDGTDEDLDLYGTPHLAAICILPGAAAAAC
jgi:hypothetical protein